MTFQDQVAAKLGLSKSSIVREIQRDLLEETVGVSNTLRKARLAAKKLDLKEFSEWISNESDGYKCAIDDLPKYRKIPIIPKFFNPYNGWRPIFIEDPQIYELCHTGYVFQPIDEIEALVQSDGTLTYGYPNELASFLRRNMEFDFEIRGFVSTPRLKTILSAIRNLLLDWAIDLERAGILGEGMGFTNEDKNEAAAVTQNIYAQNIGNLGDVSGQSTVQNTLTGNSFAVHQLGEYISQIEGQLPNLPDAIRGRVEQELTGLRNAKGAGRERLVRAGLSSIKKICEGVTTSLAAQGIAAYLAHIL
jgi:hypothetical protein